MQGQGPAQDSDFVRRLVADFRLASFARNLLESKSVAAAVGREE
jgi:hypothetical protein